MPFVPHQKTPQTAQQTPIGRKAQHKGQARQRRNISSKPDAADREIGAIEDSALTIRPKLVAKAHKDKRGTMQRNAQVLYSFGMRGHELTEEWITKNITALCPWGVKTRARQLAWDYWGLGKRQGILMASSDWEV